MAQNFQVRIHNCTTTSHGRVVRKVLSIKNSELFPYVDGIRRECNKKFTPNRHEKFEKHPLLIVKDSFDTEEEFVFETTADLPAESVLNSKGDPVLIIMPEDDPLGISLNRFDVTELKSTKEEEK